ncbi:MAG: apolipoprotein A1/A4/E family protein [Thermoprotei archaeon]|nr:apolipoprotein A1/A4/E family protein [Thermoprotei archaeon]
MSAYAETILATVLKEAIERIAKKIAAGKKLSDSEVVILLLDQMNRRMEERFNALENNFNSRLDSLRDYVDTRFNDLEKNFNTRLDALKDYVDGRLSEMSRRIDDLSKTLNARIDDINKNLSARIEDLSANIRVLTAEVSSIKSDVIKILKEGR